MHRDFGQDRGVKRHIRGIIWIPFRTGQYRNFVNYLTVTGVALCARENRLDPVKMNQGAIGGKPRREVGTSLGAIASKYPRTHSRIRTLT